MRLTLRKELGDHKESEHARLLELDAGASKLWPKLLLWTSKFLPDLPSLRASLRQSPEIATGPVGLKRKDSTSRLTRA